MPSETLHQQEQTKKQQINEIKFVYFCVARIAVRIITFNVSRGCLREKMALINRA